MKERAVTIRLNHVRFFPSFDKLSLSNVIKVGI